MNITFLGIGNVGSALADNLAKLGHQVTIAARNPSSETVQAAQAKNATLAAKPIQEAVDEAEIVFLATPFPANEAALTSAGQLTGKIVVDCTNPVGAGLNHSLNSKTSGGEMAQTLVPEAKVVKAFSISGYENFENVAYPGYQAGDSVLKPAMLIAGDDGDAKATITGLCEQLGWETVDTGPLAMSLHLEHMALLWIKLARVQGLGAEFTWAILRR